jgi:hypothetical protein
VRAGVWLCLYTFDSAGSGPATRGGVHDDADNDGEEAAGRGENDHDEHADESGAVLSSHERRAGAEHSDANSAEDLRQSNSDADPEGSVAGILSELIVFAIEVNGVPAARGLLALRDEQGDDKAVDATSLAQDDTDEVLRLDAGHLYERAENRGRCDQDTPAPSKQSLDERTQPRQMHVHYSYDEHCASGEPLQTYQAAPKTESPIVRPIPRLSQA